MPSVKTPHNTNVTVKPKSGLHLITENLFEDENLQNLVQPFVISREDVANMKMPRVRKLNVHSNLKLNLNNSL
jgi:hypothetical protein